MGSRDDWMWGSGGGNCLHFQKKMWGEKDDQTNKQTKEHTELRAANEVPWVYLGQPGHVPFLPCSQDSQESLSIWLFVLSSELDLMPDSCKQGTSSSSLLIKVFRDVDGSHVDFSQTQNTCISGPTVPNALRE